MANKKILVVTYYWYPFADVGTYRISRFCKYLARKGWDIVVLTADKASAGMEGKPDDPLLEQIKVYRSTIIEPTELLNLGKKSKTKTSNPGVFYQKNSSLISRLAVWVRLNLMIPDAKFTWKWFAVPLGKKVIKQEQPDIILSTSPPPTTSLIAADLAKWSKLPWLADFRDPWSNIYYYDDHPQSGFARSRNKKLEEKTLKRASKITMVNHGFFPEHESILKEKAKKIPNGFDPDHQIDSSENPSANDAFSIRYFGSLKANQHLGGFISALQTIEVNHPEIANELRVEFYGSIDPNIKSEIESVANNIQTNFHGFIPHDEMMVQVQNSQLLLLSIGRTKNSKFALSTKVFEYMLSGNPVLGIGPTDGAAAELVRDTEIGKFFEREDGYGMLEYIRSIYNSWKTNSPSVQPNSEAIEAYNFEHLTDQLERLMNELVR